jgi:hypothetical protein
MTSGQEEETIGYYKEGGRYRTKEIRMTSGQEEGNYGILKGRRQQANRTEVMRIDEKLVRERKLRYYCTRTEARI